MNIADITMGKAVLENLADKKRLQKQSVSINSPSRQVKSDVFNSDKSMSIDLAKINELQKGFMKDNISLSGLKNLQDKVEQFENNPVSQRDYDKLTKELNVIVNKTKFDGENVISYLSTQVKDEKSLYTLKANLVNEIEGIRTKMADERKSLASYLVKSENLETVKDFSSEKTADKIASALDKNNISNLFKGISNINTLLGIEK